MTQSHAQPGHPAHLAHHFDSSEQQAASGKLGMWLFLATELLMFGGLFCGYSVYRANHPEVFHFAAQYLDTTLGGINTAVLITSSFTMAYAVRACRPISGGWRWRAWR
jgi:cytochrome c oxidase subunit III